MYTREQIEKFLFLDIETVSVTKNLDELKKINPKLVELWNKRTEYLREKFTDNLLKTHEEIFQSKGGLHSEFGKIICISFASLKKNNTIATKSIFIENDNEKDLLIRAMKLIDQFMNVAGPMARLVGHNIKRFDIPVLCKRSIINNITIPECLNLHSLKPWEQKIIDTCELWSHGAWQEGFVSLELLCEVLGIKTPKDELKASEVQNEYYVNNNINNIKDYCEKDVKATLNVLLRLSNLEPIENE